MNRATFLARIRAAVDIANGPAPRRSDAVAARLAHPPAHPLPACAKVPAAEHEARFTRTLEARGAIVASIPGLAALPGALEPLIDEHAGPLLVGDDPRLTALPWSAAPQAWNPHRKPEDGTAALTHAVSAVAETGTLVLASGPASPATLAFLPETHIVAVARDTIVGSFEAAFSGLTAAFPERLPRAVNLISGPSRTGDIGGRIVKGAHGPRRLIVFVYGPRSPHLPR